MRPFSPQMAVLPPEQQAVWPHFSPLPTLGFVLYGGTAIALRLGHRPSVDFDFFADQPLDQGVLMQHVALLSTAQTLQLVPNTWTVQVAAPNTPAGTPVKVSFFGGIDVGRIGEPALTGDGVVAVASPVDLLAHKLTVMLQRVEAKDYRDVVALLRNGIPLAAGLGGAATLFGPSFPPSESLKALVYFSGGDLATLDRLGPADPLGCGDHGRAEASPPAAPAH
jgi:hypothetical protein